MERIAIVMGKMHSGGKKNLVMEYYRNLNRNMIQFDFICDSDSNAIPRQEIEELGGRCYIIPPYNHIIKNMLSLKKICKENNYTIMHSYNGTMNVFSMYIGWRTKIPVRINESISMAHRSDKKTILKKFLKPFSHLFSTHFVANGEACGRWQFGNKLYNSGTVKIFRTVINAQENNFNYQLREKTRKEYGLENHFVIGHIGRLTIQKNSLFIIDVLSEMVKINKNVKLLLIGDGDLRDRLLKKIDENNLSSYVKYLGRREDIQQFYNAMDCFILPSLYEGLPVVGVEAETCGLPVFFSTEIPEESSACADLGYFLELSKGPKYWADQILEKTEKNLTKRAGRLEQVRNAGFDSRVEASKLTNFYISLLHSINN